MEYWTGARHEAARSCTKSTVTTIALKLISQSTGLETYKFWESLLPWNFRRSGTRACLVKQLLLLIPDNELDLSLFAERLKQQESAILILSVWTDVKANSRELATCYNSQNPIRLNVGRGKLLNCISETHRRQIKFLQLWNSFGIFLCRLSIVDFTGTYIYTFLEPPWSTVLYIALGHVSFTIGK